MLKVLVPVDGSETSLRALEHLIGTLHWLKDAAEIHLINVQYPLHGDVSVFVDKEQIRQFHQDEGLKALAAAREKLDAGGVGYVHHIGIGDPAHVIAHYAREKAIDQIVMGTRGLGAVAGLLLGSVAAKVIHLADAPVLLVK
ncbi:MAG TPA: universal stress protein [Burkholderiales bacterium]